MRTRSTPSTPGPLRPTKIAAAPALIVLLVAAACAPKTMKLPSPGAPAADGAEVIEAATRACRAVRTMTAEVAVSGRVGGQKVRGRMTTGVAAPASARIEAVAPFGAPLFIFVATGDAATLLLPRDGRVLEHGRAAAVLEAVSGVPLGPAELRDVLTGCPDASTSTPAARRAGDDWRVVTDGDDTLYVHRDGAAAPWRLLAVVHAGSDPAAGWRAEYRDFADDLPRTVRLAGGSRFDLTLALSQVDVNTALGAEVFRVDVPRGTEPITLDELRRNGPLADRKAGR